MKNITYMSEFEFEKLYGTEEKCLSALMFKFRANKFDDCVREHCIGRMGEYVYQGNKNKKSFLCPKCLKHVHPMAGTIFENTHVKITTWFKIIYEMLSRRNGVSVREIARRYGITYKPVYRMFKLINEQMGKCVNFYFDGTVVEIDESGIRTGNKGVGKLISLGTGRGNKKTTSVLVIAERGGDNRVMLVPILDCSEESILPIIKEHVSTNTIIYTDEFSTYNCLSKNGYTHDTVNHSHMFVKDSASTNVAENVFSRLVRSHIGSFQNVSEENLRLKLNELSFKLSYRNHPDYGFSKLLFSLSKIERDRLRNAA